MPRTRRFNSTFLGGEVSPQVFERYDFEKRNTALMRLENMIPRLPGPVRRRDGSRLVTTAKNASETIRLIPFVFSRIQAYILELGNLYMRFYRDEGQLIDAGFPVEITTPWTAAQLRDIDFDQDADTMVFVHPDIDPQILRRFDDVTWGLTDLNFRPPPTEPVNYTNSLVLVTLSNTTGSATMTSTVIPTGTFRLSDVGRTVRETGVSGTGLATVTGFTSLTELTIQIFETFSSTNLFDGFGQPTWQLDGSPLANVAIVDTETGKETDGGTGNLVSLLIYKPMLETTSNPDLITNGSFTTDLSGWTDLSGQLLASGTASGGAAGRLEDAGENFKEDDGVQVNHRVENLTAPREGADIINNFESTAAATGNFDVIILATSSVTFAAADAYEIRDTGFVEATVPGARFNAGENGAAWLEQIVVARQIAVYEYVIITSEGNVSVQAGIGTGKADVLSEVTITPGETRARFVTPNIDNTPTFNLFFQIRNNQFNTKGKVDEIRLREVSFNGWNLQVPAAPGTYLRINGGYVQTVAMPDQQRLDTVVVTELDDTQDAIAGSWTIEESLIGKDGGFPQAVAFFQSRLWLAVANQIFGSVPNQFENFALGPDANDAVAFSANATEINPVHWIIGENALVLGTRAEEFFVNGTDTSTIRAGDIDLTSPTGIGTEPIQPVRVRNSLLIVKAGGKRVFEFALVNTQNERGERDLSILSEHLFELGEAIVEIAWQDEPIRTLWVVTSAGNLFSLTYLREHDIWAWARHGSSDAPSYGSIARIPHPDGDRDQVWISVRRSSSTSDLIEFFDDDNGLYDNEPATMLDSTIRYSGPATTMITGLSHLDSLSNVWVVDDKGAQGPFTVSVVGEISGIQRAVSEADVGIYFDPNISTLRPSVDGTGPTGLLLGKVEMFVRLFNTGDGVKANGRVLKLRKPTDLMDERITPVTGEIKLPSNGTDRDATVTISQSIPESFEIDSIAGSLEVEDI